MTDILVVNGNLDNEGHGSWITLDEAKQLTGFKNPVILNWARLKTLPERRDEKGVRFFYKESLLILAASKPKRSAKVAQRSASQAGGILPFSGENEQDPAAAVCEETTSLMGDTALPEVAESAMTQEPSASAVSAVHNQDALIVHIDKGEEGVPVGHSVEHSSSEKEIASSLTPEECERLLVCETTIREGLGTFVAVGTALMEIREARLYRQTHSTFEAYAKAIFTLSRPRVYQLVDSAQVMKDLSTFVDIPTFPQNEGQARELLPWKTPEQRGEKWKIVLAAAGDQPLTAKFIRQTLRPTTSPAAASAPNKTTQKAKACLARLRGLLSHRPVGGLRAMELIAELEQILADAVAVATE